jgi:ABC-type dipeptide/oligopeptide/nickel transport system permease component
MLLVGVSALSFALLSLSPGNFFDQLRLDPQISPDTVSALRAEFGMDRPWPVRYVRWIASGLRGDFGYSVSYRCPVGLLLWPRVRNTLLLTSFATLLAWMVALPWGVIEALHRGEWLERAGSVVTAMLLAIPELLLALLFLLFAARRANRMASLRRDVLPERRWRGTLASLGGFCGSSSPSHACSSSGSGSSPHSLHSFGHDIRAGLSFHRVRYRPRNSTLANSL